LGACREKILMVRSALLRASRTMLLNIHPSRRAHRRRNSTA
jgi:hypothetical protein